MFSDYFLVFFFIEIPIEIHSNFSLNCILFLSVCLFLCLYQMAVDVVEGLLEEDDEVVQVSNEVMTLLFCLVKVYDGQLDSYFFLFHFVFFIRCQIEMQARFFASFSFSELKEKCSRNPGFKLSIICCIVVFVFQSVLYFQHVRF